MKKIDGKTLEEWIVEETKPKVINLWGADYDCTFPLVDEIHGDGLQLVYLQPIDARPDYYLLKIDSSIDVHDDDSLSLEDKEHYGRIEELLVQMVENKFDNIDRYTENEDGLYYEEHDEVYKPFEYKFPMLMWGGGSWGSIVNFKD